METVQQQLATAQEEVKKPFPKEAELNEKMERLSELNALLNMDEKGNETIMADEDIGREGSNTDSRDAVEEKELPETADRIHKPSILERLKQEKAQQNTAEQPLHRKLQRKNTNRSYKRFPVRVFSGGDIKWRVCLWQII